MAVQVTKSGLEQAISDINTSNNSLKGTLDTIYGYIQETESIYQSDSGSKIRTEMDNLKPKFTTYYNVINNFVNFLEKTKADYETQEENLTNNASQLAGN